MTKTINGLTVTTSAAAGDFLAIWRAANSDTRKITKANFMGGVLTGAGTIATGGFTLTVPATGTASLLGTAQTFTALKIFSAGISLGNETLSTYDTGTWTPALQFGGASTGITYTTRSGSYLKLGSHVWISCEIALSSKGSATGTATLANLPFAADAPTHCDIRWNAMATAYLRIIAIFSGGSTTMNLRALTAATTSTTSTLADTDFGNTAQLTFSGWYLQD